MKLYVISLAVGLLVGVIYALLEVKSPAPPVVALIGLLGILVGEQAVPVVKRVLSGQPVTLSWFMSECAPPILGASAKTPASAPPPETGKPS
ncbi:XapX domain-containing protein [Roseixanthobacter glucoisosaccharinicivorans]|uniref:XapX domain-containing protein n=1 Tax=Roseixanthobacter glucoisosaccharinicivorans TaxID=3119923 RepID=UPI00372AD282